MAQERIDPGWAWARKLDISAGVKIGDTVYLSGTVAFDSDGNVVGGADVHAQAKQVFRNIEEALAAAGATMADHGPPDCRGYAAGRVSAPRRRRKR